MSTCVKLYLAVSLVWMIVVVIAVCHSLFTLQALSKRILCEETTLKVRDQRAYTSHTRGGERCSEEILAFKKQIWKHCSCQFYDVYITSTSVLIKSITNELWALNKYRV